MKIKQETINRILSLLDGDFEANIVPYVAVNSYDPELILAYLLGAQDAVRTLRGQPMEVYHKLIEARTLIKNEVRPKRDSF